MNGYTTSIDSSNSSWRYYNVFLRVFLTKLFRKVVLPVPAFPVRKIFREVFSTRSKSWLFILGSKIVKKNKM
jgi:hypothetical protein